MQPIEQSNCNIRLYHSQDIQANTRLAEITPDVSDADLIANSLQIFISLPPVSCITPPCEERAMREMEAGSALDNQRL